MAKANSLSATLSVIAAIVSALFAAFTFFQAERAYQAQFQEKIGFQRLLERSLYFFPYEVDLGSVSFPLDSKPKRDRIETIRAIGSWYKFRISNNSNKPVSLAELRWRIDSGAWQQIVEPLIIELSITSKNIRARDFIVLPKRLDVGEAIDCYVFLPLYIVRFPSENRVSRQIFRILIDEKKYKDRLLERDSPAFGLFDRGGWSISGSLRRSPVRKSETGNWIFLDANQDADDGFRFADTTTMARLIVTDDELKDFSNEIELSLSLSSGHTEYLKLIRQKSWKNLPFYISESEQ